MSFRYIVLGPYTCPNLIAKEVEQYHRLGYTLQGGISTSVVVSYSGTGRVGFTQAMVKGIRRNDGRN